MCEASSPDDDPFGCLGELPPGQRLSDQYPERFGPWRQARCPFAELREPDPQADLIVETYVDWKQGVLTAWPDRYAAPVEEGVRYLHAQVQACEAEVQRQIQDRLDRQRPPPGTVGRDHA